MRFSPGRSLALALAVTAVAVVLLYLVSTLGFAAYSQSRTPSESAPIALPMTVENAPPRVGTTGQYGPLGAVSMVFAGTKVEDGLVDEVDQPWLAVSARSGDYRALTAPDLPSPQAGAVAISPEGDRLAWATGDGVVLYTTATDESRTLPLDGATHVGRFAPDGSMVTVHANGLAVLDLESGDTVADADGTDPDVAQDAAWHADSGAVDYVSGGDLITLPADGSEPTTQPSPFDEGVPLAWSPSGEQLIALQPDAKGVPSLVAAPANGAGELGKPRTVDTSGVALHSLLGFSSDDTVAVTAYLLESGSIERVLDIQLDGGSPVDVTALPSPGDNWRSSATLATSDHALQAGSTDFGSRVWPWSYTSRLAASVLIGVFFLGLWLTRRRRTRRQRRP